VTQATEKMATAAAVILLEELIAVGEIVGASDRAMLGALVITEIEWAKRLKMSLADWSDLDARRRRLIALVLK
jgi:hypothetical protein